MAYRSRAGPVRRRPEFHTARSVRFRSTPVTGTARRVPAASSAATARELSTAGPAPAATAALIAVVDDSSACGGTGSSPAWARSASSRKRLVPEPLAARSHADALRGAAVVLFALLLAAWLVVAVRTARGMATGRLFLPMTAATRP
jgi:hypothetical protein